MEDKYIRPSSITVLFTTARVIDFSFQIEDEGRMKNRPPPPDDFEEDGKWRLL